MKLLAAVGAGLATVGVKVNNAYSEFADDSKETFQEQIKEILPILIAFASYAAKIIIQFRYVPC